VRFLPGRYVGAKTINIGSSGAKITFIPDQDSDVIFDGATTAIAGGGAAALTGWTPAHGTGTLTYNSGNSGPDVWQLTGQPGGILAVFADDYVSGTGTIKVPGTSNWWWVCLGNMGNVNTDGTNPNFRIHSVVSGNSTDGGHNDTWAFNNYGGRTEDMHSWQGQFVSSGSTLYARFHSTLASNHSIYATTNNSAAILATGRNNIVWDGGVNKRFKFYRWKRGFELVNCVGWEIKNCKINWTYRDGIHMDACTGFLIDSCIIYGGTFWEHSWGNIYAVGGGQIQIKNCDLAYGQHQGIGLRGHTAAWVHNNTIHHQNGYAVYFQNNNFGHLIEHNFIQDCGYIDRLYACHRTPHGAFDYLDGAADCITRRNEVLRCGTGIWKGGGGFNNCQFYNNTFHDIEYDIIHLEEYAANEANSCFANRFQNNIGTVITDPPGSRKAFAVFNTLYNQSANSGWNNRFVNNDFYIPTNSTPWLLADLPSGATEYTTAQVQGGTPSWMSGLASGNIGSDPAMVSPNTGNFDIPGGSPCLNTGTQTGLQLQPTIQGAIRSDYPAPSGTVDIGAREGSGGGGGGGTNNPPTANLTSNVTTGTAPLVVNFVANGSDDLTADASLGYAWNFGDKNATSGNTVSGTGKATYDARTFTYSHPGTYVAQVTITDGGSLTVVQTRTITVTSGRGGTLMTSTAGQTITSAGGGTIPAPGTQTPIKCFNQLWLSNGANLENDSFSQSGLVSSPGAPQSVTRQFASATTVTRIRVSGFQWDSAREHIVVMETSTNGTTWSPVHSTGTWKTLTGSGNEFTECDFAPRSSITHIRVTENSNSAASNFMTLWEIQTYTDSGGGGGGGENTWTAVEAFDSYNTDPVAALGPNKVIDGIGPDAGIPQNRWLKGPITVDGTWIAVGYDANKSLKTFEIAFWKPKSIVYRYDIDTSTDKVVWTNRVSDATSSTNAYTSHVLGGAVSARYWRVKFRTTSSVPCASCMEMRARDF
jgi:PKD repeat protein